MSIRSSKLRPLPLRIFAWNPYRFHCYGEPPGDGHEGGIFVADLFPGWMIPGLWFHEWIELHTGSHRLGVCGEILLYNLLWPLYHAVYLRTVRDYPLAPEIME